MKIGGEKINETSFENERKKFTEKPSLVALTTTKMSNKPRLCAQNINDMCTAPHTHTHTLNEIQSRKKI